MNQARFLSMFAIAMGTMGPSLFVILMQHSMGKIPALVSFFLIGASFSLITAYKDVKQGFIHLAQSKSLRWWILGASIMEASAFLIFVLALEHASVTEVYIVSLSSPIFVVLWGYLLLGERQIQHRQKFFLAIMMMTLGVAVYAFYMHSYTIATGGFLAFLAAACMRGTTAIKRKIIQHHQLASNFIVGLVMLGASFILSLGSFIFSDTSSFTWTSEIIWLLIALGVLTIALPELLQLMAAKLATYTQAGFMEILAPVVGMLWSWVLLSEEKIFAGPVQVMLVCFVAGAVIAQKSLKKE